MMGKRGILDYVSCIFFGLNITSIDIATSCTMVPVFSLSNAEVLSYKWTSATCPAPKPHGSSMGCEEGDEAEGRAVS